MSDLTLEQLPKAFAEFFSEWQDAKQLLFEKSNKVQPETHVWFDLTELCDYLPDKPAKATAYGWVHESKIPYHKGAGQKKLRFLKSEIDNWLCMGRNKTFAEATAEANAWMSDKKKGQRI